MLKIRTSWLDMIEMIAFSSVITDKNRKANKTKTAFWLLKGHYYIYYSIMKSKCKNFEVIVYQNKEPIEDNLQDVYEHLNTD